MLLFMGSLWVLPACSAIGGENENQGRADSQQDDNQEWNKNQTQGQSPAQANNEEAGLLRLSNQQLQSFELSYTELTKRSMSAKIRLNGKVIASPESRVSVSSPLGGYVAAINLLPGTQFKKGQVLAVLEDNQYIQLQQEYLTTKTQLKMAELNYHRQQDLNKNKAASDKVLESAEAEYQRLLVSEKALGEKLRLIRIDPGKLTVQNISRSVRIYAPFDGVVSSVNVNKGKYAAPADILFELVNPRDPLLHLKVFEKDLGEMSVGQTLLAYTNEQPDKTLKARIVSVGNKIGDNGTADLHARIEGDFMNILEGRYMNAEVLTGGKDVYTLPDQAVVDFEDKHYVFETVDANTFRWITVQTGQHVDGYIEILNPGSLLNKQFVNAGAYTLLMELKNTAE